MYLQLLGFLMGKVTKSKETLVTVNEIELCYDTFGESTDQDHYRWGKLHRIVFDHPFVEAFNIPPQASFKDLSPELPGLARDGGYETVNVSSFSARAQNLNSFMFGRGSVRRYVGRARTGLRDIAGVNVIPGGPSGIPGNPNYATQLGTWLTADYHKVNMGGVLPGGTVEVLKPPAP